MTQYLYAFNSDFSGQVLIEPLFFELYNMTMTSFPIIIFAVFDFQYNKEKPAETKLLAEESEGVQTKYLMTHPLLYKIGIDRACYTQSIFI